jgi:hypothetical protein
MIASPVPRRCNYTAVLSQRDDSTTTYEDVVIGWFDTVQPIMLCDVVLSTDTTNTHKLRKCPSYQHVTYETAVPPEAVPYITWTKLLKQLPRTCCRVSPSMDITRECITDVRAG